MNIIIGKERAVIITLMDTYGVSTILQSIFPYVTDANLSASVASSALVLDKELWVRSLPIMEVDPETDLNIMAFNVAEGIDVMINRMKMENGYIVPRFGAMPLEVGDPLHAFPETLN